MSKIINMTFLLRNPNKVKEMVKKGFVILVKQNDEIVMEIKLPTPERKITKFPVGRLDPSDQVITKDDIYDRNSWLDK